MYTLKIFRVIFFSGAVTNIVSRKDHNPDLNCIKVIYTFKYFSEAMDGVVEG